MKSLTQIKHEVLFQYERPGTASIEKAVREQIEDENLVAIGIHILKEYWSREKLNQELKKAGYKFKQLPSKWDTDCWHVIIDLDEETRSVK